MSAMKHIFPVAAESALLLLRTCSKSSPPALPSPEKSALEANEEPFESPSGP